MNEHTIPTTIRDYPFHQKNDHLSEADAARYGRPTAHVAFYAAITTAADEQNWPTDYHSDLYFHDRRHDGTPCIWILREYGTAIVPIEFESEVAVRSWMGRDNFQWIETFIDLSPQHYHWNGLTLRRITGKQAVDLMRDGRERFNERRRTTLR